MLITMDTQVEANELAGECRGLLMEQSKGDRLGDSRRLTDEDGSGDAEVSKSCHEDRCRHRRFPRTLSQDRQMQEYDKFYEAVGEIPPSGGQRNLEIDDTAAEESFDDDDESEFEIQPETIPAHVPLPDPIPVPDPLRFPPFKMLSSLSARHIFVSKDFDYKGIGAHGLEITKCGVQRGNYSTLHRKAWLEVSDSKHRYGKNLRLYYRHWGALGYPTNNFFDWLDSKGDVEGQLLPDLPECPRSKLDTDTVLYINDAEVTRSYSLSVVSNKHRRGQILDFDGEPISTGPDGWIFVLRDNVLYGSRKVTAVSRHSKQRFHHSSFFGGKAVAAAGIIVTDQDGVLTHLYPHSGHYRPGEHDMQRIMCYLYSERVDLNSFKVDMQQIMHVCRNHDGADGKGEKSKKTSCLHLQPASHAAHYLSHKAHCIQDGLFEQLERILQLETVSVTAS
jgi:hypothetical protein